jgi:hypothetical protein
MYYSMGTFLEINQRPPNYVCTSIGNWEYIWEVITVKKYF